MTVGIIGAGAWGTALGVVATDAGHSVVMWAREPDVVQAINTNHTNSVYLPQTTLPSSIQATNEWTALGDAELIILATPTQHSRSVLTLAEKSGILTDSVLVSVAKGIEVSTQQLLRGIAEEAAPSARRFAVLSGPSHAEEVVRRMATSVVCASEDLEDAEYVQNALSTSDFRIYTSTDIVGVEICGALKNVIAIAAGIVDGAGMGDNTKAALITRGLAEITRLGVALGAEQRTFYGLAGLGDLIVTAGSPHSRNRYVGEQIGKGAVLSDVLNSMTAVAEGVPTTKAALDLARSVNVELPITEQVSRILFENANPQDAIHPLMNRPLGSEA